MEKFRWYLKLSKTGEGNCMHWCLVFPSLTQDWSSAECKNKHPHFPHKYRHVSTTHRTDTTLRQQVPSGDLGECLIPRSTSSDPTGKGGRSQRELKTSSGRRPAPSEEQGNHGFSLSGIITIPCILSQQLKCEGEETYIKLRILEEEYWKFASELYRPFTSDFREK